MIDEALDFLTKTQNPDGGWGAGPDRSSGTEATALAVLALQHLGQPATADALDRGLAWLTARQNADGSWPLVADRGDGSWATALASLAFSAFDGRREAALRGARWLLGQQGRTLGWLMSLMYRVSPERLSVRLNPDLRAWSWTAGTFSWVEPTAYALMTLNRLRPDLPRESVEHRIRQGKLLIYDRMCAAGGWNYGNSYVFGSELPPYPDITAVALIALQQEATRRENQLSLQALKRMLATTPSGLALAWSILCLSIYGVELAEWRERLVARFRQTGFLGETRSISLALLALGERATVFRL